MSKPGPWIIDDDFGGRGIEGDGFPGVGFVGAEALAAELGVNEGEELPEGPVPADLTRIVPATDSLPGQRDSDVWLVAVVDAKGLGVPAGGSASTKAAFMRSMSRVMALKMPG